MAHTIHGIASYVKNPSDYIHYFEGFTLFTDALDTSSLRNILTTVFVVVNFAVGLLGARFMKERNLTRLRKKLKSVPISHLTSWISMKGALKYAWNTYRLPGGYSGFSLMLLTGGFGIAHQYFVNSFILPVSMQMRCPFEMGIVTIGNDQSVATPVSTFSAARTVYNAQYQVYVEGGIFGIYEKVNNNYTNFSPTEDDVLGGWTCSPNPDTIMAATDWISFNALQSYLLNEGFLFTVDPHLTFADSRGDDSSILGFLAWSADQTQNLPRQWNVRASVATNLNGSKALEGTTANVTNLECQLIVSNARWDPPILPSYETLTEWGPVTFGSLMTASSNYGFYIEWMLNAIMMVGGSGNNDNWTQKEATDVGGNPTYGCTVNGTKIMPAIWIFLIVLSVVFVLLIVADIWMFLFQYFRPADVMGADLVKQTPSTVQEWQLQFLRERMKDENITLTEIGLYSFIWDNNYNKYVLDKGKGCDASINPMLPPFGIL